MKLELDFADLKSVHQDKGIQASFEHFEEGVQKAITAVYKAGGKAILRSHPDTPGGQTHKAIHAPK